MQWVEQVAHEFSLGDPAAAPSELSGGRAHQVWRLDTTKGRYVAKALNPYHAGDSKGVSLIRDKIRLELASKARGVTMPAPVASVTGDMLAYLPGPATECRWWRVHEWLDGRHPNWGATSPAIAHWVGRTLATVHDLATRYSGPRLTPLLIPLDQWRALIERAGTSEVPWAGMLDASFDMIGAVNAFAAGRFGLDGPMLRSHSECDQRNVIVGNADRPYLLDWDSLIVVHPVAELFAATLNWAGVNTGNVDLGIAAEVIAAYRRTAILNEPLIEYAGYWLAWQLGWLWLSAHRSLGDDVAALDMDDRPDTDIVTKLALLPAWLTDIEQWSRELS